MIIKSLSRKKPSFIQLYDYMVSGAEKNHFVISKNLYNTDTRRDVIGSFQANAKHLPKRKNGVFLYHEIISLPEQYEFGWKRCKHFIYLHSKSLVIFRQKMKKLTKNQSNKM
jgi:hypothetical protein